MTIVKFLTLLLVITIQLTIAAPLFPFLPAQGRVANCDDCCGAITNLRGNFTFFGIQYNKYLITSNGLVQFNTTSCVTEYTPIPFPITSLPVLAVYWGDADIRLPRTCHFNHFVESSLMKDNRC